MSNRRDRSLHLRFLLLSLCFAPVKAVGVQEQRTFPVGFMSTEVQRTGRFGVRTIDVAAWFPRINDAGAPVTLGELWDLAAAEDPETTGGRAATFALAMTGDSLAPSLKVSELLNIETNARHNGAVAAGRHPVIVWGARHFTQIAQYRISEMLASRGFIVVSAWSNDLPRAMLWETAADSAKLNTIAEHAGDVAAAVRHAARTLPADTSRVIALAWSYGGQAVAQPGLLPGLRGIVALDANVVSPFPVSRLPGEVPVLWLVGADTSRRGFDRLSELSQRTLAVQLPELAHGNFNALEGYLPGLIESPLVHPWSLGGPLAVRSHDALTRVVLAAARHWTSATPAMETLRDLVIDAAAPMNARVLIAR